MEKPLYPIFIDLAGKQVIVIGGGKIATHKVQSLLTSQAAIVVIAPQVTAELQQLASQNKITIIQRCYEPGDLDSAHLVICACGQAQVNQQVRNEADSMRIFCNVVDEPEHCTYYTPAVAQQGPLMIAISTSGVCPSLAKTIKQQLQEQYNPNYKILLQCLEQLREHVKTKYPESPDKRKTIIEAFLEQALELIKKQDNPDFTQLLEVNFRRF